MKLSVATSDDRAAPARKPTQRTYDSTAVNEANGIGKNQSASKQNKGKNPLPIRFNRRGRDKDPDCFGVDDPKQVDESLKKCDNVHAAETKEDNADEEKNESNSEDEQEDVDDTEDEDSDDDEQKDGEDDEDIEGQDDGSIDLDYEELVELDDLEENGFNWNGLVNNQESSTTNREWNYVEPNHVPKEREIDFVDAERRCIFLGIEATEEEKERQLAILQHHRRQYKNIGRLFVEKYFIEVCNQLKITYGPSQLKITEWDHVVQAFLDATTKEKMKKFAILFYVSFDFIPSYKQDMTQAILRKMGLKVVKKTKSERGMNCFHGLSSLCIKLIRDSLNEMGDKNHGLYTTKVRPHYILRKNQNLGRVTSRKPKTFYGWMIAGKHVSMMSIKCPNILLMI